MEIDIQEYMRAGYVALAYTRLQPALEFVEHCCVLCPCRYKEDESLIECNIGDDEMPMWVASGYYWEKDHLFKKRS